MPGPPLAGPCSNSPADSSTNSSALNGSADRIVDKMPENYLYLGLIATLFPRAKLIHCRRDVRDVAVSCWLTDFGQRSAGRVRWDYRPRFAEYQRVMEHWRRVLPVPMLEVDYEATIADLEQVARALVAWWSGMEPRLPGVPQVSPPCAKRECRPGPPGGLPQLGGSVDELRAVACPAVREAQVLTALFSLIRQIDLGDVRSRKV